MDIEQCWTGMVTDRQLAPTIYICLTAFNISNDNNIINDNINNIVNVNRNKYIHENMVQVSILNVGAIYSTKQVLKRRKELDIFSHICFNLVLWNLYRFCGMDENIERYSC